MESDLFRSELLTAHEPASPGSGTPPLRWIPGVALRSGNLKSGRGLPQSKTLRDSARQAGVEVRQVLDCASPLALSVQRALFPAPRRGR